MRLSGLPSRPHRPRVGHKGLSRRACSEAPLLRWKTRRAGDRQFGLQECLGALQSKERCRSGSGQPASGQSLQQRGREIRPEPAGPDPDPLQAFGDLAEDADWAVIYYAGHGIEIGGVNYVIPIDAALKASNHVDDEALSLDRVMSTVGTAKKMKLVILDACRDNPFVPKMRSGRRAVGRSGTWPDRTAARRAGGLCRARRPRVALDGETGNSPFATALVEDLASRASKSICCSGARRRVSDHPGQAGPTPTLAAGAAILFQGAVVARGSNTAPFGHGRA